MKRLKVLSRNTGIIIALFSMIFFGCRGNTPPVNFYTLSPAQEAMAPSDRTEHQSKRAICIGVGPVMFPDFLNKPQIVTRSGSSNKINYAEFHRWGGYLDKDFLRVMAENLSALLSTDQVRIHPWGNKAVPNFQIEFDVKQFDGQLGGSVTLNVIWTIRGGDPSSKPLMSQRSVIRQPVSGNDHDALVSAYSQALEKLSREIASVIESISKDNPQYDN